MTQTRARRTRTRAAAVVGGLTLCAGAVLTLAGPADAHEWELAKANLRLADGQVIGSAIFLGIDDTVTRVRVRLDLPDDQPMPGYHGLHVHANSDPANGSGCIADSSQPSSTWFVSADGHLAESGQVHGQHIGDLPPLLLTQTGRGYSLSITDRLQVSDVLGRAVLLHAGADNLGNIPVGTASTQYTANSAAATDLTARTGNAGDRVACGVVQSR